MPHPVLRLIRPANVVTSWADILAGYAAAGVWDPPRLGLLLLSTTGLYAGGIVLNDFFDAPLDAKERPERPIPSGAVSRRFAAWLGAGLLAVGVAAGWSCTYLAGMVSLATAASVLLYDGVGKHHPIFGPFNMGLCRGLNLVLGMGLQLHPWQLLIGTVTLCYIAGVTVISRGEVKGGTRRASLLSLLWLAGSVLVLSILVARHPPGVLWALPFFVLLVVRIVPAFTRAIRTLNPKFMGLAVRAGVLSLIVLDSGLAALFGGPWYGVAVLALYAPATLLSKLFAVT